MSWKMLGWKLADRWWREWTTQAPAQEISAIVSLAYFAAYAFFGVFCAFVPLSIASTPAVTHYTEVLATVVPSIGALTQISSFPSHTRWTLAVLWTSVPISAVIVARVPWFWIPDMTRLRRSPWLHLIAPLIFGLVIVMMTQLDPDVSNLSGRAYGERFVTALSNFRILFGAMGGVMCGSVALCCGLLWRVPSIGREVLQDDFR